MSAPAAPGTAAQGAAAVPPRALAPRALAAPRRVSLLRHQLDARSLIAYLGVAMLVAFALENPLQIAAFAAGAWLVAVGVLELAEYRPYLMYGSVAAVGVALLNPLVSRAGTTLLWVGPVLPLIGRFSISAEAIVFGLAMAVRLLGVIALFALYACLVDPDALYRLIAPISLGSSLVMALSIRLFPASIRDAEHISDAMRARGMALDAGGVVQRTRAHLPIVEALTMTSLDRAMDLAESLEARGYGRQGRTSLAMPALAPRDRVVLALAASLAVAGGWAVWVSAGYRYYPLLADPARASGLAGAAVLGVLAACPLGLEWGWSAWHSSKSAS